MDVISDVWIMDMTSDIDYYRGGAKLESCKRLPRAKPFAREDAIALIASTSVTQYASKKTAAQPDLPEKARPDYPILHLP